MKKIFTFASLVFVSYINAQDADPIVTDRPTQSAAAAVVPKGDAIIEYGFVHEDAGVVSNTTFANILVRIGMLDRVEFRLSQNYLQRKNDITDLDISGLSPITVGTKIHLLGEEDWIPQMSIIGQVTLKNGKKAFRPSQAVPEIRLNFSNTLTEYLSLGYNVGMLFPEDNSTTFYTIVLGYSFAPGWTVFAEPYGSFADGNSDQRFNTGLIYLCSNTIQFDISAGWGLSDISPDSFIGFGAAIGF